MPARVNFTDAGVAFDADGALAPAAQLVAKLRLAIDAGAIPEGATMPSIRSGAEELGVHSNTLRKVYAALEAQGYATTRHGSGTVAHVRDAAGAAAVRRIADGALESARGEERTPNSWRWRSWPEPPHRDGRRSLAPGRAARSRAPPSRGA
jgi:DNA-binding transcriptional MocR family regulator